MTYLMTGIRALSSSSVHLSTATGLRRPATLGGGRRGHGQGFLSSHSHKRRISMIAEAMPMCDLAGLDSETASTLALVLKPTLSVYSLLMIVRIVMTWYPEIDGKSFPWSIAYNSTEGLLEGTRKVVKPFNGLDVSPIVWVAILSFLGEILTGPQGILNLIARKGI